MPRPLALVLRVNLPRRPLQDEPGDAGEVLPKGCHERPDAQDGCIAPHCPFGRSTPSTTGAPSLVRVLSYT